MAERTKRQGKRANGEGSIYQRGDNGKWVAQIPIGFYASGNVKYKRATCATQREAREHLRALQREAEAGLDLGTKAQALAAYLGHWLANVVKPSREPKTYEGYAYTVGLITPTLGRVPLAKLTPAHVEQLLNAWFQPVPLQKAVTDRAARADRGCHRARCSMCARPYAGRWAGPSSRGSSPATW